MSEADDDIIAIRSFSESEDGEIDRDELHSRSFHSPSRGGDDAPSDTSSHADDVGEDSLDIKPPQASVLISKGREKRGHKKDRHSHKHESARRKEHHRSRERNVRRVEERIVRPTERRNREEPRRHRLPRDDLRHELCDPKGSSGFREKREKKEIREPRDLRNMRDPRDYSTERQRDERQRDDQ